MLEKELYTELKNITGGIYAIMAPQDKALPYSTYQIISDIKTNTLEGVCDYPQTRFQIDVYAGTLEETVNIKRDIETILYAATTFQAIVYQTLSDMSDEGNVYRTLIDFKLTK